MSEQNNKNTQLEADRSVILNAKSKGRLATLKAYVKFSAPGWLQSATTLGGGSLASALYLGVLGGCCFMWLQPFAMVLGIITLSAIAYISLSIKNKPMRELNANISPILGYGWAVASMIACLVNAMPQFALGVASVQQNIFKGIVPMGKASECAITLCFFAAAMGLILLYSAGGKAAKLFERIIMLSVATIVICFFSVVVFLATQGEINWQKVWAGFIPNLSVLSAPSPDFMEYLNKLGADAKEYWSGAIVKEQRDVIISAAAMAVGINMTFLFPYSMLKKGWDKDFRGLAIFNLCTSLFVPFLLATSCIVIAAASQFHAKPVEGLVDAHWTTSQVQEENYASVPMAYVDKSGKYQNYIKELVPNGAAVIYLNLEKGKALPPENLVAPYLNLLEKSLKQKKLAVAAKLAFKDELPASIGLSHEEKQVVSMLVKRDAMNLASTLAPLVGDKVAKYIFGIGVFAMAMNATLMNMLICGLCFAEIFGKFGSRKWELAGSSLVFFSACVSLFLAGAKMWLVIYAGVITMVLLPIASGAFLAILNSKSILKDATPRGWARFMWNALLGITLFCTSVASLYVLHSKIGIAGPIAFFAFMAIVVINYIFLQKKNAKNS
ncbi:MAG: divalent metal cation transporter [Opitutales bacterium]|nr:divalent metal cation transporter [Opitutales bacterium]